MAQDITFLFKQFRFAALTMAGALFLSAPSASADSILLSFQFTAADLESAIQQNTSGFTGYSQAAYFAVFLQPSTLTPPQYGYNTETAPVDPSTNIQFTAATYAGQNSTTQLPPEGNCNPTCDTSQYLAFSKGVNTVNNSSVMLIGNNSLPGVHALIGQTPGANGSGPVSWGSQTQTIGGLYANNAVFNFTLLLPAAENSIATVGFNGYVSAIQKGVLGFKSTPGIKIAMEFTDIGNNVYQPVPEPSAGILVGGLLIGLVAMRATLRRRYIP